MLGTDRVHIEFSRGTPQQCRDYCSKEETRQEGGQPVEWGSLPEQGKRCDLDEVKRTIRGGATEKEVFETYPTEYIKYSSGIKRAIFLCQSTRSWKTEVFWWHGSTGSGKSRQAFEEYPDAYWKAPTTKWWDGYTGQDTVIVDDYRRDFCTFAELLRLFDRYPHSVESKGGSVQFTSRRIVITTPRDPRGTWAGRADEDLQQLERRIEEVKLFGDRVVDLPVVEHVRTFN